MFKKKNLHIILLCFLIFLSCYPTVRLLTFGNHAASGFGQYVFAGLPDLFAALILGITLWGWIKSKTELRLCFIDYVLAVFWLTNVLIGFIIAQNLVLSLYAFRMTWYPMMFYLVFRFAHAAVISKSLRMAAYWFLVLGVAGIVLYFLFFNAMIHMIQLNQTEVATYFVVRMTSVFWSPVVFSTFMAVAFLYFYYKFLTRHRWLYFVFMAILMFCVVMAMSRGTMIAVLAAFLLMSVLMRDWKRSLASLGLILTVFCFTAFYIATPGEVFFWLADSTIETVGLKKGVTRVDLWINAFENFSSHPLGYGLGKAGHTAARFFSETDTSADVYSTDGWFLKTLNETGVWGLFSYLFFAVTYVLLFLKKKLLKPASGLMVFFFCFFTMVNIQSLVSNVIDFYLFSFLYWAIIGASVNLIVEPKTEKR